MWMYFRQSGPYFGKNYQQWLKYGILVGDYVFCWPCNTRDAHLFLWQSSNLCTFSLTQYVPSFRRSLNSSTNTTLTTKPPPIPHNCSKCPVHLPGPWSGPFSPTSTRCFQCVSWGYGPGKCVGARSEIEHRVAWTGGYWRVVASLEKRLSSLLHQIIWV